MIITPPPPIKFDCPFCQQPIEAPGEMRGEKIRCPGCQAFITVTESYKDAPRADVKAEPQTAAELQAQRNLRNEQAASERRQKVKDLASGIFIISLVAFGIAACALVFALASNLNDSGQSHNDITCLTVAANAAGVGIFLFLTSQIVHIRANTEK